MQENYGLDGWFESYCIDNVVGFVGGVIERALTEREERVTLKGVRSVPVYETVEDVFKAIESGERRNDAAAFIEMSKKAGRVTTYD